ncbi:hypothetical protein Smic_21390 [Streptomyces microflavus]|uniref:Uncharacterized protein n=1 Tax=Streptomyces microflavus TaxID=1919 RepID=A0A7J0CM49_STRMI|nr:hypothetical protein Smic_21390 [Streptomyces microflavus]
MYRPGEGGGQGGDEKGHGQQHEGQNIPEPLARRARLPSGRSPLVAPAPGTRNAPDGGTPTRSCLWPRVCRRHIPLPCCSAPAGTFSHQVRTNTRVG